MKVKSYNLHQSADTSFQTTPNSALHNLFHSFCFLILYCTSLHAESSYLSLEGRLLKVSYHSCLQPSSQRGRTESFRFSHLKRKKTFFTSFTERKREQKGSSLKLLYAANTCSLSISLLQRHCTTWVLT